MTRQQFETELISFIRGRLVEKRIQIDHASALFSGGLIDSLKILDLIAYVEKALNIHIDETDLIMEHFSSVSAIAEKFYTPALTTP